MRLAEIIDIIKNTELKQLIVGEQETQVYTLLNLALIDVYGRFSILKEDQRITMEDGRTRYHLLEECQSVIKVYGRIDKDDEIHELPINDINDVESVFTPEPYILHVPNPLDGDVLSVIQAVTPPFVTKENVNTLDFIIPPQFLEPIVNYVGYRAYISMNGDDNTESSSHYRRYIRSCNDVRLRGLTHYTITTNVKQTERGFPAT